MNEKVQVVFFVVASIFVFAFCNVGEGANTAEWDVTKQASKTIVMPISDDELLHMVGKILSPGRVEPRAVQKIDFGEFGLIFVAKWKDHATPLLARFVARRVPCGDCHDVFFLL